MGKLIVELPDKIHKELKKKAAVEDRTLKDMVTGLIGEYLSEEKARRPLKETGLCGSWSDNRTAQEIIEDIKARRSWFKKRKN